MGLKKDYYGKCATCMGYSLGDKSKIKVPVGYYCHNKKDFFSPGDSCNSLFNGYVENKKVTDDNIKDALKALEPPKTTWFGSYSKPGGCFITTIVCDIIGLDDDSSILKAMRSFRDDYLAKHEEYIPLLIQYDSIGPEIALHLQCDKNKKKIARKLVANYLSGCVFLLQQKKFDDAASLYYEMVEYLASYYDVYIAIDTDFEKPNPNGLLGHARIRKSDN